MDFHTNYDGHDIAPRMLCFVAVAMSVAIQGWGVSCVYHALGEPMGKGFVDWHWHSSGHMHFFQPETRGTHTYSVKCIKLSGWHLIHMIIWCIYIYIYIMLHDISSTPFNQRPRTPGQRNVVFTEQELQESSWIHRGHCITNPKQCILKGKSPKTISLHQVYFPQKNGWHEKWSLIYLQFFKDCSEKCRKIVVSGVKSVPIYLQRYISITATFVFGPKKHCWWTNKCKHFIGFINLRTLRLGSCSGGIAPLNSFQKI